MGTLESENLYEWQEIGLFVVRQLEFQDQIEQRHGGVEGEPSIVVKARWGILDASE